MAVIDAFGRRRRVVFVGDAQSYAQSTRIISGLLERRVYSLTRGGNEAATPALRR